MQAKTGPGGNSLARYSRLKVGCDPKPAWSAWGALHDLLEVQPLGAADLDLWVMRLDVGNELRQRFERTLWPGERVRADSFVKVRDSQRFIAAHGVLRFILAAYLDLAPERLEFGANRYGKPELAGIAAPTDLCFNMSHSSNLILIAVTKNHQVGIDVERIRDVDELGGVGRSVLNAGEQEVLAAVGRDRRPELFFRFWTAKEAHVKALGRGLGHGLRRIETVMDHQSLCPVSYGPAGEGEPWLLIPVDPAEGFIATAAVRMTDD